MVGCSQRQIVNLCHVLQRHIEKYPGTPCKGKPFMWKEPAPGRGNHGRLSRSAQSTVTSRQIRFFGPKTYQSPYSAPLQRIRTFNVSLNCCLCASAEVVLGCVAFRSEYSVHEELIWCISKTVHLLRFSFAPGYTSVRHSRTHTPFCLMPLLRPAPDAALAHTVREHSGNGGSAGRWHAGAPPNRKQGNLGFAVVSMCHHVPRSVCLRGTCGAPATDHDSKDTMKTPWTIRWEMADHRLESCCERDPERP